MERQSAGAQMQSGMRTLPEIDIPTLRAPSLSGAPPSPGRARATLLVLTGTEAGQLVVVERAGLVLGRAADADLVVEDPSVSSHHARVVQASQGGYRVEDLRSTNGTFVNGRRVDVSPLKTSDRLQLGPHFGLRFAITDELEASLHRRLYDSSIEDPLTHVFNRRYLDERLVAEVARAVLTNTHAAVLMVDVDGLKQVNDCFGHMAGDRALCMVAAGIVDGVRARDCVARFGGDEFVVIASGADGDEAARLAERVRRSVGALPLGARGESVRITVSVGAATLCEVTPAEDPTAALLELADQRMYMAKTSGRNRVCVT
jgi:diguanylate cyclase (GGDEF)-like protein